VTFSRNRAKNEGGAVSNEDGGTMNLTNVTFADNKAKEGSAISTQDEGIVPNTTNVLNVLFAKNQKKNRTCAGSLTSLGGNLDFGTSCGFGAGDLSDTDPKLQKLSASSMPVHELKGSSPAIDGGTDPNCPLEDQLGNPRVDIPGVGTAICDIGAVEFQGS
jgi:predicted outer membrane repeat protein